jgi:hypothetical protein
LAAVPGAATTIVGHVGGDTAFNLYMQGLGVPGFENLPTVDYTYEVFSAQGRIGNNATNGTNEIGLHWNNPADETPPSSSPAIAGTGSTQYVWGTSGFTNALVDFRIQRVGSTVTFTFGPLGTPLYQASITDPYVADVTLLAFRSRAQANPAMTKNQASLTNLVLNGTILIPASAALSDEALGGGTVVENVVVKDLLGDFVLTGQTVLNWNGSRPGNSSLAWQIKAFRGVPERTTDEVPEPSTLLLAGAGLILIRLRK